MSNTRQRALSPLERVPQHVVLYPFRPMGEESRGSILKGERRKGILSTLQEFSLLLTDKQLLIGR